MELRSHLWADLTRDEIAAARDADALVVIPIGATEQHAGHLPTGTDSLATGRISLMAAQMCPHPVLVAPTVSVAFSPHHASWPGTLTLRLATLQALLDDITACVSRAGFRRQLLVNAHGGNRGPLTAITTEFITAGREVGYVDYFAPAIAEVNALLTGQGRGVTHAGEVETSLVMALVQDDAARLAFLRERAAGLAPRAKATHRATGAAANTIAAAGAWWPPIYLGDDLGYNGDPGCASVETGEKLIAVIKQKLSAFFADFAVCELRSGVTPPPG
jgi:creatinine amidohydrolase